MFDPLHRPIEVKDPLGHSVKTGYDEVGNIMRIEDEIDWEGSWTRPVEEVRRELGLPAEGFMPRGTLEETGGGP